jgi:hypothetical protein
VTKKDPFPRPEIEALLRKIDQINGRLDSRNLMVFQKDDGKWAVSRILRGQAYAGYDKYVMVRGSTRDTFDEAVAFADTI